MIAQLMLKLFARFTAYNPDLIDWAKEEEQAALSSAERIRQSNAVERELIARRQS